MASNCLEPDRKPPSQDGNFEFNCVRCQQGRESSIPPLAEELLVTSCKLLCHYYGIIESCYLLFTEFSTVILQ